MSEPKERWSDAPEFPNILKNLPSFFHFSADFGGIHEVAADFGGFPAALDPASRGRRPGQARAPGNALEHRAGSGRAASAPSHPARFRGVRRPGSLERDSPAP